MGKPLHGDMPWPSPPHENHQPNGHVLPEEEIPTTSLAYKPALPPVMAQNSQPHNTSQFPQSPASGISRQLPSPVGPSLGSTCMQPTWRGFIHTTRDGLMLLEACLQGQLMHIPRRPHDRERQSIISSGNIFVYEENASGIRRWTDGITWSPSRIMGNFLVYRELRDGHQPGEKKRAAKKRKRGSDDLTGTDTNGKSEEDRQLIGSLSLDAYNFKPGGLAKKTLSVELRGVRHHIISYYRVDDIKAGIFRRPIQDEFIANIEPRRELVENPSFKFPVEDRDDKINVVSPTSQMQPSHHLQMVNAGLPVVVNVPQQGGHMGMARSSAPMMYHSRTAGAYGIPMGSLDPFDIEGVPQSASSDHSNYSRPSQAHSASPTIAQHPHGSPTEPQTSKSLHLQTLRRIHTSNSDSTAISSTGANSASASSVTSLPSATSATSTNGSDMPSSKRARVGNSPHTPHTPHTPQTPQHMLYGWDHHSNHHGSPHSAHPYSAGGPMSDWNFSSMQAGHGHHHSHAPSHHSSHHANGYQPHHQAPPASHHGSHPSKYGVEDVGYHGNLLGNGEFTNQPVGMYILPQSGGLN
jgi:hypothetical protein